VSEALTEREPSAEILSGAKDLRQALVTRFRADVAQLVEYSLVRRCGSESVAATKKEDCHPVTSADAVKIFELM
jgi:hypothetical protein